MRTAIAMFCAGLVAPYAFGQSEAALKEYFEGRMVVVKLDMPATQTGVDVYADARRPLNFDEYSGRVRATGIAIRSGESVMITKIKLKDKLIEFQLAGGGYGTAGDDTATSVYVPSTPKSNREKELEREVKTESDAGQKRRLQNDLDDLRKEREREDHRNRVMTAAASEEKKRRIAEQRLHAGSRFNLRYQTGVPAGVTPGGIMAALAEYAEFPFVDARTATPDRSPVPSDPRSMASGTGAPYNVHKGMTWQEVRAALGEPEKTSERMEGRLKVTTASFARDDQRIEAEFVEGVLVKYAISSK
jgi:hypothetical protein